MPFHTQVDFWFDTVTGLKQLIRGTFMTMASWRVDEAINSYLAVGAQTTSSVGGGFGAAPDFNHGGSDFSTASASAVAPATVHGVHGGTLPPTSSSSPNVRAPDPAKRQRLDVVGLRGVGAGLATESEADGAARQRVANAFRDFELESSILAANRKVGSAESEVRGAE